MTMTFTSLNRQILKPTILVGLVGSFIVVFLFVSCKSHPILVIPEGAQTLTGVLLPVQISLSRRGTHELMQHGQEVALVESSTVNLRQMEGVDVIVVGHFERNTDPAALPVLIASGVTLASVRMHTVDLSGIGLSLDVPPEWNPQYLQEGIRFASSGSSIFIAISTGSLVPLPTTNRMTVGGRPAVLVSSSGASTLSIHNGSYMILFEFADSIPGGNALILRIIRSIHFTTPSSVTSIMSVGTGTAIPSSDGAPCGGSAGLLCPSGSYCAVTDTVTNIGRCRTLKR